jgi:exodeoxyribonuclease I
VPAPSPVQIQRAEVIAQSPEFRSRVGKALATRFPEDLGAPPPPVEKQIFGGFHSHADKALLTEFQRADWLRRQEITATLTDARLRQLGRRLVALHAPALLSPEERGQFEAWLRDRWSAPNEPDIEWTGLAKAQDALGELRAKAGVDQGLVGEIETYLKRFEL